jgi:hypothetical protein
MKSSRLIGNVLVFTCLVGGAFALAPQGKGNSNKAKKEAKQDVKEAKQDVREAKQDLKDAKHEAKKQGVGNGSPSDRPAGWDKGKKTGWGTGTVPPGKQARHSRERQQQLITEQRQRVLLYRQRLEQQQLTARQYADKLRADRRTAAYRYQQAYLARLQQQQAALRNNYNYNNDPYFYTAPTFSYNRDGSTYQTNQYGANQLRAAVNAGYSEGFRAGQADQQDRFTSGYQNSYAYQDANYGYNGYANDQETYNHYFRQGFTKGYDDGYNRRTQFGTATNGKMSIMGTVLNTILSLQNLQQ